jgi:hypothetical protein
MLLKLFKGVGLFFLPAIIAFICLLLGQKYPTFNAIGVIIVALSALGVIGLFFYGLFRTIFKKK